MNATRNAMLGQHLGWKKRFWNEIDFIDLVKYEFPWIWPAYQHATGLQGKLDLAKYIILYIHGGIWMDLELWTVRSSLRFSKWNGLIVPLLANDPSVTHREYDVTNAWLAAEKGHPFFLYILDVVANRWAEGLEYQGAETLFEAIEGYELQRNDQDPPIYFLEPGRLLAWLISGHVVIPDWRRPTTLPPSCYLDNSAFNRDECMEKVMSPKLTAFAFKETFDRNHGKE
ncbi:hypothetical protein HDV03_003617 [Kappamyces sp. JEL0829]|nr:hypothetical protein HDV03_003617 [Kappamyces sp. JEL0829]